MYKPILNIQEEI